jgi:hypothetical protein
VRAKPVTIIAISLSMVVAGCGAVHQQVQQTKIKEAWATTNAATAECREKRIRKELKTYRESVECSNPTILAAWQGADYPFMDLVSLYTAARLVGAERIDKGTITEAEFELQLAELRSRLAAEDERRSLAFSSAQAAQAQANAQSAAVLMQGLAALQAANTPPRPVNCTTTGPYSMRSTNCF